MRRRVGVPPYWHDQRCGLRTFAVAISVERRSGSGGAEIGIGIQRFGTLGSIPLNRFNLLPFPFKIALASLSLLTLSPKCP